LIFGFLLPGYLKVIVVEIFYYTQGLVLAMIGCSLSIFNFNKIIKKIHYFYINLIFSFGYFFWGVRIRAAQEKQSMESGSIYLARSRH